MAPKNPSASRVSERRSNPELDPVQVCKDRQGSIFSPTY